MLYMFFFALYPPCNTAFIPNVDRSNTRNNDFKEAWRICFSCRRFLQGHWLLYTSKSAIMQLLHW